MGILGNIFGGFARERKESKRINNTDSAKNAPYVTFTVSNYGKDDDNTPKVERRHMSTPVIVGNSNRNTDRNGIDIPDTALSEEQGEFSWRNGRLLYHNSTPLSRGQMLGIHRAGSTKEEHYDGTTDIIIREGDSVILKRNAEGIIIRIHSINN